MKFEYLTGSIGVEAGADAVKATQIEQQKLNEAGALGWELVSVLQYGNLRCYYFKRLLTEERANERGRMVTEIFRPN